MDIGYCWDDLECQVQLFNGDIDFLINITVLLWWWSHRLTLHILYQKEKWSVGADKGIV